MSQLLSRIGKPLVCKSILVSISFVFVYTKWLLLCDLASVLINYTLQRHNNNVVRWSSSVPIYPYMLLDYMLKFAGSGKDSSDGRISIGEKSCREEKHIVINDQALANEVRNAMPLRDNDFKVEISGDDPTIDVRLLITCQPTRSKFMSVVRPPPLPTGSVIQNIAMTSYLDIEDEDWVLAVKLYGSKIKLFRRSCKPTWIDVNYMPSSIYTTSSLMYSKMDERFYVPTPGGDFLYSLDPKSTEDDRPEFIGLWTEDLTKHLKEHQWDVNTFAKTVHFLEAPSGEQFLVKWYVYLYFFLFFELLVHNIFGLGIQTKVEVLLPTGTFG